MRKTTKAHNESSIELLICEKILSKPKLSGTPYDKALSFLKINPITNRASILNNYSFGNQLYPETYLV